FFFYHNQSHTDINTLSLHDALPIWLNANGQSRPTNLQAIAAPVSAAEQAIGAIKNQSGIDLTEKIRELVRLAQEQGYLTYNDIKDRKSTRLNSSHGSISYAVFCLKK